MAEPAWSSSGVTSADSCREWLRRVGALTVVPASGGCDDEIATATDAAAELVARARGLLDRGLVASGGCAGASCAGCPAADLSCDLVRDLAACLPAEAGRGASLAAYRRALAGAGAAVFTCRRTLHPSGSCLFGAGELCGRVLAAAHRLG